MPENNDSGRKTWTDGMDAAVKAGVLSGASYANIAGGINRDFGTVLTRSAVIGRASRLGLSGDTRPASALGHGKRPKRKPGAATRPVNGQSLGPMVNMGLGQFKPVALVEPVLDLPNLWCEPVDLLDLQPHQCRWPMDGGKFCGLNKTTPEFGKTEYCKAHHAQSVAPRGVYRKPLIARR